MKKAILVRSGLIALLLLAFVALRNYIYQYTFEIFYADGTVDAEVNHKITNRLLMIIADGLLLSVILALVAIRNQIKPVIKNLSLMVYVIALSVLVLEGSFMYVKKSHGVGEPFASKLWFHTYWNPVNSFTFRDKEWNREALTSKPTILFLGDSFTAGDGIQKVSDRYSDIVASQRPAYEVVNLGIRGADPLIEAQGLAKFSNQHPVLPHTIVWQYYGNDVDLTAYDEGLQTGQLKFNIVQEYAAQHFKAKSFLLDYVYWSAFHPKQDIYTDFLKNAYTNDKVVQMHLAPMIEILNSFKQNNIRAVVVILPFLQDIPLARQLYVTKLCSLLKSLEIEYIDLSTAIEKLPISDRIVNVTNPHPSVEVNKLTADALLKLIPEGN